MLSIYTLYQVLLLMAATSQALSIGAPAFVAPGVPSTVNDVLLDRRDDTVTMTPLNVVKTRLSASGEYLSTCQDASITE